MLALMQGCSMPLQLGMPGPEVNESVLAFERWVDLYSQVQAMTPEDAATRLAQLDAPQGSGQKFYYGLLHSRLRGYPDWIRARDAFAGLADATDLSASQRDLADLMRRYNQSRINAYVKQLDLESKAVELNKQLVAAEQEKTVLQQKIHALTELEAHISTRKEE
jgi:hypothetical protein